LLLPGNSSVPTISAAGLALTSFMCKVASGICGALLEVRIDVPTAGATLGNRALPARLPRNEKTASSPVKKRV